MAHANMQHVFARCSMYFLVPKKKLKAHNCPRHTPTHLKVHTMSDKGFAKKKMHFNGATFRQLKSDMSTRQWQVFMHGPI